MSNPQSRSTDQSRRASVARRVAMIAAMRHVAPVNISDSEEQFEDYDTGELWDLADEADDDDLYRAVHQEIMRRQMSKREKRRFRGPVRTVFYILLVAFLIGAPILAMRLFD